MTETTELTASTPSAEQASEGAAPTRTRRKATGLSGMVLAELQQLAQGLGITGTARMRKGQLIDAIKAAQADGDNQSGNGGASSGTAGTGASTAEPASKSAAETGSRRTTRSSSRTRSAAREDAEQMQFPTGGAEGEASTSTATESSEQSDSAGTDKSRTGNGRTSRKSAGGGAKSDATSNGAKADAAKDDTSAEARTDSGSAEGRRDRDGRRSRSGNGDQNDRGDRGDRGESGERSEGRGGRDRNNRGDRNNDRNDNRTDNRSDNRSDNRNDDDDAGGGRRRRRRGRDRYRDRRGNRDRYGDADPQLNDDDVLIPVAGILDVLDNYAFVRTSGYLSGPNDVYVSLAMVKRHGLRKGDTISGVIRQPREGERREKYNPLVRVDTVNGADPELARQRSDFSKLTPLYPQERLRLETESSNLTNRIIDLIAPIGKGQRALIVSPAKAGKTLIMQSIANAITHNNPESHLMVVLVDERPEEVTDMERAVKGEVIASTFDRPADDHTTVAELSIERAKRLVELGHDVVVLLDSITRLGRAYNQAAPASGRILSGGVDSSALYPPKKFFGAARNIEHGGSLTIIATALIETGSKMDEVIFEEFKGTGNMELRLNRQYANKRIFPAIDVDASSTRREELLMSQDELGIIWKLRRLLSGLDGLQALELLLNQVKKTQTNVEFLMSINKTMPTAPTSNREES